MRVVSGLGAECRGPKNLQRQRILENCPILTLRGVRQPQSQRHYEPVPGNSCFYPFFKQRT